MTARRRPGPVRAHGPDRPVLVRVPRPKRTRSCAVGVAGHGSPAATASGARGRRRPTGRVVARRRPRAGRQGRAGPPSVCRPWWRAGRRPAAQSWRRRITRAGSRPCSESAGRRPARSPLLRHRCRRCPRRESLAARTGRRRPRGAVCGANRPLSGLLSICGYVVRRPIRWAGLGSYRRWGCLRRHPPHQIKGGERNR